MALRVLVVDDTAVFRRVVSDAFASLPDVEVVGVANHGRAALARIEELQPDLVSLDIEMPELDGVQVLRALKEKGLELGVLVLSAHTQKGGDLTMKALELGAFDFITKPTRGTPDENRAWLSAELAPRIKAFQRRREIQGLLRHGQAPAATVPLKPPPVAGPPAPIAQPVLRVASAAQANAASRPELVAIGVSTGGPNALVGVLPQLPADFPVPILIVQHMPPLFTNSLANSLNEKCRIQVKEAESGELIQKGVAYIAPGGRQMKLVADGPSAKRLVVTDDPPENHCRPSVDFLFRSLALGFPGKVAAVILTGMGNDGTLGLRLMKRGGAFTIAQDEATCVVFGMPKEAIQAGVIDVVTPLDRVATELMKAVRGGAL